MYARRIRTKQATSSIPVRQTGSAHAKEIVYSSSSNNSGGQNTQQSSFEIISSNDGSNKDAMESNSANIKESGYTGSSSAHARKTGYSSGSNNRDGQHRTKQSSFTVVSSKDGSNNATESNRGNLKDGRYEDSSVRQAQTTVYTSSSGNLGAHVTTKQRSLEILSSTNGSNKDMVESISGSYKDSGYADSSQDLLSQDSESESYSEVKMIKSVSFEELEGDNSQLWVQSQRGMTLELEEEVGEDEEALKEELLRIFERERTTLEHYFKNKMEDLMRGFRHRQIEMEETTRTEKSMLENEIAQEKTEMQKSFAEEIAKLTHTFNEERVELELYYKEQIREMREEYDTDQREMDEKVAREKIELQERLEAEYQSMLRTEITESKHSAMRELTEKEEQYSRARLEVDRKFQVEIAEAEIQVQKVRTEMETAFAQDKIKLEGEFREKIAELEARLKREQDIRYELEKLLNNEKTNVTTVESTRRQESEKLKTELETLRVELDEKNRSTMEMKKFEEDIRVKGKDGLSGRLRDDFERMLAEHKHSLERNYQQEKDTLEKNIERQLQSERQKIQEDIKYEKEKMKEESAKERDEMSRTMEKRLAEEKSQMEERVSKERLHGSSGGTQSNFHSRVDERDTRVNERLRDGRGDDSSQRWADNDSIPQRERRTYDTYGEDASREKGRDYGRDNQREEGYTRSYEKHQVTEEYQYTANNHVQSDTSQNTRGSDSYSDTKRPLGSDAHRGIEQPSGADRHRGFEQPSGSDRRQGFEQPSGPERRHVFEQPLSSDRRQRFEQPSDPDRHRGFEQTSSPDRRQGFEQPETRKEQSSELYYVSPENENALRTEINELRRENEGLKAKIEAMEENIELHKTYKAEAKEEIGRLQKAKDYLQARLRSRDKDQEEVKMVKDKADKREKSIKENEAKIQEFERKVNELKEKLTDSEKKAKSEECKVSDLEEKLKQEKERATAAEKKTSDAEAKAMETSVRSSTNLGRDQSIYGARTRQDTVTSSAEVPSYQEPTASTHSSYSTYSKSGLPEKSDGNLFGAESRAVNPGRTSALDTYSGTGAITSALDSPGFHGSHSHVRQGSGAITSGLDSPSLHGSHSHGRQGTGAITSGLDSPGFHGSHNHGRQGTGAITSGLDSPSLHGSHTHVRQSSGAITSGLDSPSFHGSHSHGRQGSGVDSRMATIGKSSDLQSYPYTKDYSGSGKHRRQGSGLDSRAGNVGKFDHLAKPEIKHSNRGALVRGSHTVEFTTRGPESYHCGNKLGQDSYDVTAEKKAKYEKTLAEKNKLLQLIKELQQKVRDLEEENTRVAHEERVNERYAVGVGSGMDNRFDPSDAHGNLSDENASLKAKIDELQRKLKALVDRLKQEKAKVSSLETELSSGNSHYIRDMEGLQDRLQQTGDAISGSNGTLDPDLLRRIEREITSIGQFIRNHVGEEGHGELSHRSGDDGVNVLQLQMEKQELEMKLNMAKEAMSDYVNRLSDKMDDLQTSSGLTDATLRELYSRNSKLKETLRSLEEGQKKSYIQNEQLWQQKSEMQSLIGELCKPEDTRVCSSFSSPRHVENEGFDDDYNYTVRSQFRYNVPELELSDRFSS